MAASATTTPAEPAAPAAALRDFDELPGLRWPPLLQSASYLVNPMRFIRRARGRYGSLFRIRSAVLGKMVYIADPDLIKQVFTGDPEHLRAGEANSPLEPIAGIHSILLLDGERHMRMRKLMLPSFHGEAIKHYAELMEEIASAEVDRMPVGKAFAMRPHAQSITLDVILRAVFGIDDAERQQELRHLLSKLLDFGPSVVFEWSRIDLGKRSPWGRYLRLRRRVDEILYAEMGTRRDEPDLDSREDIFSLLLRARDEDGNPLTDQELRDELITLLLAGHETTANTLAWVFERLVRHPDKLAKLRSEIESGDEAYLDAVVKETMRLRPVIMEVGRKVSARPYELGGYRIPEGVMLAPAIALTQLDPDLYPRPNEFRPERFIEGAPAPYSWLPFGGGVRRCIGAAFAQLEMKIVLATIVRRVDLRPEHAKPERQRVRGITMVPHRDARVIVTGKRPDGETANAA